MKKLLFILFIAVSGLYSQTRQIILDENFSDWQNVTSSYVDAASDANGNIDFLKLKITNDNDFVYFLIAVNKEINLQSDYNILLCIDTDNNSKTGFSIHGIGAELVYNFGTRSGTYYKDGNELNVHQHDIGLVSSPTVTSRTFELLLKRSSNIQGNPLFSKDTFKVVLTEDVSGGDFLPDEGGATYVMNSKSYIAPPYRISRPDTSFVRIMAYNVLKDGLFKSELNGQFKRIFQAIRPDIIGFEEVYNHSGSEIANLISQFLPGKWYHGNNSSDVHVVCRYPVLKTTPIDGNAAFLLDLTKKCGKKMLFVVAHPPCCNKDDSRQKEIDHIMSFIRDANLEKNTPIVIVGDMNFVGKAQQVKTLLSGDIINESEYGNDFVPDWDGTDLDDSKPITTGYPATFTWYSAKSSYSPGRLDYVVYTGSVMKLKNSFALFTPAEAPDTLTKYGLQKNDATEASDHLPVVSDFKLDFTTKVSLKQNVPFNFELSQNYPNPFPANGGTGNPTTIINYSIPVVKTGYIPSVELKVYDVLGREVAVIVNKAQSPGNYSVKFNAANLPSGIYFYSLRAGNFSATKKMVILK